jgi:hypothetical protein
MPRKMARQTLERHAGACCAGSRPYLGSGLLGSPENRYNFAPLPSSSGESKLILDSPGDGVKNPARLSCGGEQSCLLRRTKS